VPAKISKLTTKGDGKTYRPLNFLIIDDDEAMRSTVIDLIKLSRLLR